MQEHSNDWCFVESEQATARLTSAIAWLQNRQSDLEDDKTQADEKITSLLAAVEEKDHGLTELNKRIEDLTAKNTELVARTHLFTETKDLVCQLERMLAMANAKVETRVQSLEKEKHKLAVAYSDAQQAGSKLSHEVEELRKKNKVAALKIEELKNDKDRSTRRMHAAQDLTEKVQRTAATFKDRKNELLRQVEALETENKVLKQERAGLLAERTFYGLSDERSERLKAGQKLLPDQKPQRPRKIVA